MSKKEEKKDEQKNKGKEGVEEERDSPGQKNGGAVGEDEKTADGVAAEMAAEAPAEEVVEKVPCELCTPPRDFHPRAIYEHVRDIHQGWSYSSRSPHFIEFKNKSRVPDIQKRAGVSGAGPAGAAVPAKKKFSLNIGLKLNLSILDGLGKLAEDKEAFKFDESDLATLKEAYDAMGGILTTEDPRIAILVINGKVVIPGILFNWENLKNNLKKKFKGVISEKFTGALERGRAEREKKAAEEKIKREAEERERKEQSR